MKYLALPFYLIAGLFIGLSFIFYWIGDKIQRIKVEFLPTILLLLSLGLLAGCGTKEVYNEFERIAAYAEHVNQKDLIKMEFVGLNDLRWEMLKDYLGVVEWEIKGEVWKNNEYLKSENISKTILTNDPIKKEWVELECDDYPIATDLTTNGKRCQELKKQLSVSN